jgi:hypothetical protein
MFLAYFNAVHYRRIKNVHSSVNFVGDEFGWFFDKTIDPSLVSVDHYTVLRRFFDTGHLELTQSKPSPDKEKLVK